MILPKEQRNEIINGITPLLIEVFEDTDRVRKLKGRSLIYEGVTKDKDGKQIQPETDYVFTETVRIPVNHKRRLNQIIYMAKTQEGMQEDLARYLVKFGKSREAITESIDQDYSKPKK